MKRLWRWLTRCQPERPDFAEAEEAIERAQADAERIDARWAEVDTLSTSLRRLRERNHFIEGFRKTLS